MIVFKKSFLFLFAVLIVTAFSLQAKSKLPDKLRVCADPNNLPFSDSEENGFENKIAEIIAKDLKLELEYVWFPQRMGFIRNTLKTWIDKEGRHKCDLVMGLPTKYDRTSNTKAYYRSTYAFIFKKDGKLKGIKTPQDLANLSEKKKANLQIAVFSKTPAVDWLMKYDLFYEPKTTVIRIMSGDARVNHQDRLRFLLNDKFDVAFVWGPIAGHFAKMNPKHNFQVIPLDSEGSIRFDYSMSMGMRRGEGAWKKTIQDVINRNRNKINNILKEYKVPLKKI